MPVKNPNPKNAARKDKKALIQARLTKLIETIQQDLDQMNLSAYYKGVALLICCGYITQDTRHLINSPILNRISVVDIIKVSNNLRSNKIWRGKNVVDSAVGTEDEVSAMLDIMCGAGLVRRTQRGASKGKRHSTV